MRLVNVALLALMAFALFRAEATTQVVDARSVMAVLVGAFICALPFLTTWRGLLDTASSSLTNTAWWINLALALLLFATPVITAILNRHMSWPMLFPVVPALLFAANVKALAVKRAEQSARPEPIEPEWRASNTGHDRSFLSGDAPSDTVVSTAVLSSTAAPGAVLSSPLSSITAASHAGWPSAPSAEPSRPRANYFVRHWRGELSLPVSYWVNGTLLGIVSVALIAALGALEQQTFGSLRLLAATNLVLLAGSFLSSPWSVVGIWHSAGHHASRGGWKGWAIIARIMIAFSVLGTLSALVRTAIPQMWVYGQIAIGHDPIGRYRVSVSPDGRSVRVVGTLREGAATNIISVLDAAPGARWLVLDSNGGRLLEARLLAQAVRSRGLNTYVSRQCASACTFVFLAGKTRAASPYAHIGFHQPSFVGLNPAGQQQITRAMIADYRAAGLPDAFLQRVAQTPPNRIWYPGPNELLDANVVTLVGTPSVLRLN